MQSKTLLKISFMIGVIVDGIVAVNWFLIALGINIPSIITHFSGSGQDYQFAMYIASLFMFGWTLILLWGYFNPMARKDLLLLTAVLLFISIILELTLFYPLIQGTGFIMGVMFRLLLIFKFIFSYLNASTKLAHP